MPDFIDDTTSEYAANGSTVAITETNYDKFRRMYPGISKKEEGKYPRYTSKNAKGEEEDVTQAQDGYIQKNGKYEPNMVDITPDNYERLKKLSWLTATQDWDLDHTCPDNTNYYACSLNIEKFCIDRGYSPKDNGCPSKYDIYDSINTCASALKTAYNTNDSNVPQHQIDKAQKYGRCQSTCKSMVSTNGGYKETGDGTGIFFNKEVENGSILDSGEVILFKNANDYSEDYINIELKKDTNGGASYAIRRISGPRKFIATYPVCEDEQTPAIDAKRSEFINKNLSDIHIDLEGEDNWSMGTVTWNNVKIRYINNTHYSLDPHGDWGNIYTGDKHLTFTNLTLTGANEFTSDYWINGIARIYIFIGDNLTIKNSETHFNGIPILSDWNDPYTINITNSKVTAKAIYISGGDSANVHISDDSSVTLDHLTIGESDCNREKVRCRARFNVYNNSALTLNASPNLVRGGLYVYDNSVLILNDPSSCFSFTWATSDKEENSSRLCVSRTSSLITPLLKVFGNNSSPKSTVTTGLPNVYIGNKNINLSGKHLKNMIIRNNYISYPYSGNSKFSEKDGIISGNITFTSGIARHRHGKKENTFCSNLNLSQGAGGSGNQWSDSHCEVTDQ